MSADNPAGLISIAALQSQDRSYLFYSRPNGELAYLKSQVREEASETHAKVPPYKVANIILDGNVVVANTKSPQVAAVSFTLNHQHEIRVYYISNQGWLQELCRSGDGQWTEGSLNESGIQASPKSLLTASIDHTDGGELKLYYNRDNDSMMWCTWVTKGRQAWASRRINDKY